MPRNWYPETPTGWMWAEVGVEDPGFGWLTARRLDDRYIDDTRPYDRPGLFAGSRMANLLNVVTQLAVGVDERPTVRVLATRGEPLVIEQADAAGLLPILNRAMLLATAGEDRYQRVWPDDPQANLEPLCVYCNLGSDYVDAVTIAPWCSDVGHQPFGVGHTNWEAELERHQTTEQLRHRLAAFPVPTDTGRTIELD